MPFTLDKTSSDTRVSVRREVLPPCDGNKAFVRRGKVGLILLGAQGYKGAKLEKKEGKPSQKYIGTCQRTGPLGHSSLMSSTDKKKNPRHVLFLCSSQQIRHTVI